MSLSDNSVASYIRSIKPYSRISVQREKELSYIIRNSKNEKDVDRAKEELITANLFFVVTCAYRFFSKYHGRLTLMDLISEGNIGLINAAGKYNASHESNAPFVSYAAAVINRTIKRAIYLDRLIHIPEGHYKYKNALRELKEKYGKNIDDDFIMEKMNISQDFMETIKDSLNSESVLYLENIAEEKSGGWQDIMADVNSPDAVEIISKKTLLNYLKKHLTILKDRERMVVEDLHFGTGTTNYRTVSKKMKISTERVRQIYFTALKKLKMAIIRDWNKNVTEKNKKMGIKSWVTPYFNTFKYTSPDEYCRIWEERRERELKEASEIISHFLNET